MIGQVIPTQLQGVLGRVRKDCWIQVALWYVLTEHPPTECSHPVQNATWIINSLKVYKKQVLSGQVGDNGSSASLSTLFPFAYILSLLLLPGVAAYLLL